MDTIKGIQKRDRLLLLDIIFNDHSYTKPFQAHPDFDRIRVAKILKFKKQEATVKQEEDEEIDITTIPEPPTSLLSFDESKARAAMTELERCLNTLIAESNDEDEKILRSGWTADQATLFDQVYKTLLTYQLARLTYEKNPNEPVLRRLALDKAVKRTRSYFAGISWDLKLTSWIHTTLIDGLGSSLFLCYLEVLQGLKAKVPSLVERLFTVSTPALDKRDLFNSLTLTNALKKSWDPCVGLTSPTKAETSPGQQNFPFVLVIPSGPSVSMATPKRARFWHSHLSAFGKAVPVNMHTSRAVSQIDVKPFLENMISAVRSKILEFKSSNPERKLVLVGWHIGALVACEVALLDHVSAVVCLGFPCIGLNGEREIANDPYQEIKAPVMFVLGSHSPVCPIDTVETLRERMKTSTQLVIVEGGDEMLKLTLAHKKKIGLTQSMVDKLVIDEIEGFLRKALSPEQSKGAHNPNNPDSLQSCKAKADKKRKLKRSMITKHAIEPKKKKKVPTSSKVTSCSPNSLNTDMRSSVSIPQQRATLFEGDGPSRRPSDDSTALDKGINKEDSTATGTTDNNDTQQSQANASKRDGAAQKENGDLTPGTTGASSLVSTLKGGQSRVLSKRTGKPLDKIGKRPKSKKMVNKGVIGTSGAFTKVSQPGTITLQSFPPGSVFLSGTSSHVRFHRGTSIFYVPSSSGPTPIIRSSSLINSSTSKGRQVLVTPTSTLPTTRPITAIVNSSSGSVTTGSGIVITGALSTTTTVSSTVTTTSSSQDTATKPSQVGKKLSQTDIQYLANIISKQKQPKSTSEKGNEKWNSDRGSNLGTPISPISTKISIGTLSNLNATEKLRKVEAAHGIVTKVTEKDGPLFPEDKQSSESVKKSDIDMKVVDENVSNDNTKEVNFSSKSTTLGKVTTTGSAPSQSTKTVPVTLTIPLSSLPGNFAIQPSFSLKALPKGSNAKIVSKINTTSTSTLSALLTQQKFVLSSVSAASTQAVGNTKLTAVVSKEGLKTSLTTTSTTLPAPTGIINATAQSGTKLAQGKQQGSTSIANFVKAPATITLHLPSSAILRDPKFAKDGNSQIKFIGLLNAQGRSPISSPIHFSNLKTRSAPVSPSGGAATLSGVDSVVSSPGSDSPSLSALSSETKRENGVCSPVAAMEKSCSISEDYSEGGKLPKENIKTKEPSGNLQESKLTEVDSVNHKKLPATASDDSVITGKHATPLCTDGSTDSEVSPLTKKEE